MSWKEDLATLVDRVDHLDKVMKYLHATMTVQSKKIDQLIRVVEAATNERGQSMDRMADRLIEMAMVNKGMSRDAAIHRRSLGEQTQVQDLWQDSPDTEWPPKGYDALSMP